MWNKDLPTKKIYKRLAQGQLEKKNGNFVNKSDNV